MAARIAPCTFSNARRSFDKLGVAGNGFETIGAAIGGFSDVHSPVVSHANARKWAWDGRFSANAAFSPADGPMGLDVSTLFLVTIYVEAMLGLLLLFAWIQNSNIRAVAWWGCAHLLRAGSIVLFGMYGAVS